MLVSQTWYPIGPVLAYDVVVMGKCQFIDGEHIAGLFSFKINRGRLVDFKAEMPIEKGTIAWFRSKGVRVGMEFTNPKLCSARNSNRALGVLA